MSRLNVKINGNDVELFHSSTVAEMVAERNVSGSMFVVEKNKEVVQKCNYSQTLVSENDVFEIVGFFGGG